MRFVFVLAIGLSLALFFVTTRSQTTITPPLPSGVNIRVLLSYRYGAGNFDSQYGFSELPVTPSEPTQVRSGPSKDLLQPIATLEPNQPALFKIENGKISLSQAGKTFPLDSLVSLDAVVPESNTTLRFRLENLTRGNPVFVPEYPGTLWLSQNNGKLLVINELDMQEYLRRVVPSEMPNTYHLEALKAQAIAARTYAYSRMITLGKGNFWKQFGADVDDSVAEQVYNNQPSDPITDEAVNATRNQILSFENQPVQAFFYSTSPGASPSVQEVWPDFPATAYLTGQSQANPIAVNLTDEASALAFFKDWNPYTFYDASSPYFRWKISLGLEQLQAILSRTLPERTRSSPRFVKTPEGKLSPDAAGFSLGTLKQIGVVGRSPSSFVTELEIQTSTGRYRVGRESNIRSLIRPNKDYAGQDITLERLNADPRLNFSALPSAAFALEPTLDSEGNLQSLTIWGGGYGHGVGMSQSGANGLGKLGKSYSEILQHFYPQTLLSSIHP